MTAEAAESTATENKKLFTSGLIFELEYLVGSGRKAAYETLRGILEEKSIEFSDLLFSRLCTASGPDYYIESVQDALGARKLSTRKLIEDVSNGIALHMTSSSLKAPEGMVKILRTAHEQGIKLVAMTALPESVYKVLLQRTGLADLDILVKSYEHPEENWPRADTWLMVTKEIECQANACLAVTSSSRSNRSALTAGLRSVAIPDSFTLYQDFGGAHMVVENLDEVDVKELLELLPTSA